MVCPIRKKKVVLLSASILSETILRRMGADILCDSSFDVIVFDCRPLFLRSEQVHQQCETISVIKIAGVDDFARETNGLMPDCIIDFIGMPLYAAIFAKIAKECEITYVVQTYGGVLPIPVLSRKVLRPIRKLFAFISSWVKNFVIKAASREAYDVPLPFQIANVADLALVAGRDSLDLLPLKAEKMLWVGSHDLYRYIDECSAQLPTNVPKKYILFLDDNLYGSTDWDDISCSRPLGRNSYYELMRNIFCRLERLHKMPVIISAHPLVDDCEKLSENLGNRVVINGLSPALCANATLGIVHFSTALSFFVLGRKPVLFLKSNLFPFRVNRIIRYLSNVLSSRCIALEDYRDADLYYSAEIDQSSYDTYVGRCIKSPCSSESSRFQFLISFLQTMKVNK